MQTHFSTGAGFVLCVRVRVQNIKSISLYGNMADGESISTPAAPTSTPGGPSTSSGATAPSPSTGRGKSAQMRSSIVFG